MQLAVAAREQLEADGIPTRVVSMPCVEWFDEQDEAYRREVLPPAVRARVRVEAGIPQGWRKFVGDAGEITWSRHFGASAAYQKLYEEFGFTAERVAAPRTQPGPGQGPVIGAARSPQGRESNHVS